MADGRFVWAYGNRTRRPYLKKSAEARGVPIDGVPDDR
jgi:hypothetical protein